MTIKVKITRKENAEYYGRYVGDVVEVPLEEYVAGVVASEVGNAAIEAAKAQAIAARTFAYPYYSKGKTITDASSNHQAFRAPRAYDSNYPNARRAAQETVGRVLSYGGNVIGTCSYSASNGGRTVSSEERWGGYRAWLIAQDDPWDIAGGVTTKTGHGVGMSQRGAKYAASIGKFCEEILAFYYPGTVITEERSETMNDKEKKIVELARSLMGSPYVYGTWGSKCTPSIRKQYAGYNPSHKDAIYKRCQVLNGSKQSCEGCKYNGMLCFDCRGFTHYLLSQVGIDIKGGGATSQYNTASNWVERGEIADMPNVVCPVFKRSGTTMIHTGMHVGDGVIIHCSVGVQEGKTTDKGWTHYGIPVGLHSDNELAQSEVVTIRPTLRKGSKGDYVVELQTLLKQVGHDCGEIDGAFGALTAAAVRCFQSEYNLTIDAVVGAKTWAKLLEVAHQSDEQPEQPIVLYVVTIDGLTEEDAEKLLAAYPSAIKEVSKA